MSERELQRIEVLSKVLERRMTVVSAALVLDMTTRQGQRLLKVYRAEGAAALRHKARGRPSNHRYVAGVGKLAVRLVREHYLDFGPTLGAEKLAANRGLVVSRETLRKWMAVQIDGSDHRWFEERGDPCTLLVFIDDATSTLQQLRFVKSENTFSYFEALELYLKAHGGPVAFYSDKHTVFRVAKRDAKAGRGMTQFGRALAELNIEILCAMWTCFGKSNASPAKGRVERVNRTLQDRLVKELRLADVSDIETANAFLPTFVADFNSRFAKVPARLENLHRALNCCAGEIGRGGVMMSSGSQS